MTKDDIPKHPIQGVEQDCPSLSVVIPVHNEEKNIIPLAKEISEVLSHIIPYEIICVDDASTDNTHQVLTDFSDTIDCLRIVQHSSRKGQSTAIYSGVRFANAPLVITIDGDGQNDPADIPTLIDFYKSQSDEHEPLMVTGWRKGRRDSWPKRISSRVANSVRSHLLSDSTPDTGCGLKIFKRADFLKFPAFDHMHRFLPALMIRSGGRVMSIEVKHRPRQHGVSHYGILGRLFAGIIDLVGVAWLNRRKINMDKNEALKITDKPGSN